MVQMPVPTVMPYFTRKHSFVLGLLLGVLLMAHGAPDDSDVVKIGTVYRLDDMAELAARLGAPVTYNRFGSLLFADTFESGLAAWTITVNGVAGSVRPSNTQSWEGELSVQLVSGTGAAPDSAITKYMPPIADTNIGVQSAFALDTNLDYYEMGITCGDGAKRYYYRVRYDHATGTLAYRSGLVAYTVFATPGTLFDQANNFHNMKLVVNNTRKEYIRFYLDNVAYPMTGLGVYQDDLIINPFMQVRFKVWGDGFLSTTLYLDSFVLTYDEFDS